MRRRNLSRVLGHVHRAGQISRSALAACTGLNRSTVGTLVGELHARGLVEEVKPVGRRSPGRPSPLVRPHRDGVLVLAGDIQVDSLSFAAVGLGGRAYALRRMERSRARLSPRETVQDLTGLARQVRDEVEGRRIVSVGVSVVGIVRRRDGHLHLAPNLGWRDVPLAALIARQLDLDVPVLVGNDADLGALAENARGAAVGIDSLIYVSSEVGVGAGVIVGGKPLFGADGYAGEVGHLPVNPDGRECGCGASGCWETEIGERALLRAAGLPEDGGREALDTLLREAATGNADMLAALLHVGTWLGIGLVGLINVFNPRCVVLGGMLAEAYPYLAEPLREEMASRSRLPSGRLVDVVPARLGDQSSLLGAAELALTPLLADPTLVPEVDLGHTHGAILQPVAAAYPRPLEAS